jgi:predicted DNA-binding transcriptional regulator YafY
MRDSVRDLFPSFEATVDGRQRRFRIRGGLSSFLTAPTVEELAELDMAVKILESIGHQPRADLVRILKAKIAASLGAGPRRRLSADVEALCRAEAIARQVGPRAVADSRTLQLLRDALIAMRRVRFSYPRANGAENSAREVVPYGLLFGRNAYLVGCESNHSDPVLYRLDRLRALQVTELPGAPPSGFDLDAYAARSFGSFQEAPVAVTLRFSATAAEAAANMVFHPSQSTRKLDDGRLEVRFTAGGQLELSHHLFTWGTTVEIVRPPELRQQMIDLLEAALAIHRGGASPTE